MCSQTSPATAGEASTAPDCYHVVSADDEDDYAEACWELHSWCAAAVASDGTKKMDSGLSSGLGSDSRTHLACTYLSLGYSWHFAS